MNNRPSAIANDCTYLIIECWLSDFNFFKNELNFFGKLLENKIIHFDNNKYFDKLQYEENRLNGLKLIRNTIHMDLLNFMRQLKQKSKNILPDKTIELEDRYEKLRNKVVRFISDYHLYKNELFQAAKLVARDSKSIYY